jgi:hypothetical protein
MRMRKVLHISCSGEFHSPVNRLIGESVMGFGLIRLTHNPVPPFLGGTFFALFLFPALFRTGWLVTERERDFYVTSQAIFSFFSKIFD